MEKWIPNTDKRIQIIDISSLYYRKTSSEWWLLLKPIAIRGNR